MGSFRRGLIAAIATLCPAQAWAEVCETLRPNWDGMPVSAIGEFLTILQTPVVLILIVATALAVRLRSEWGGLFVVVGWSLATYLATGWSSNQAIRAAAIDEGCIGNTSLFVVVAAVVCIGVVLYTAPLKRGNTSGDQ